MPFVEIALILAPVILFVCWNIERVHDSVYDLLTLDYKESL